MSLESAQEPMKHHNPGVSVSVRDVPKMKPGDPQDVGSCYVYTLKAHGKLPDVDLIARPVARPSAYVALRDFANPETGLKITRGSWHNLSEPHDEQCACTARDLAALVKE